MGWQFGKFKKRAKINILTIELLLIILKTISNHSLKTREQIDDSRHSFSQFFYKIDSIIDRVRAYLGYVDNWSSEPQADTSNKYKSKISGGCYHNESRHVGNSWFCWRISQLDCTFYKGLYQDIEVFCDWILREWLPQHP